MSTIRNKQRLIHLYRYLLKETDDEHQVTTNDLVQYLKQEDANASRKTVKDDIEVLIEEGVDVVTTKSYFNSYFIGGRAFEVQEIKLLTDGIAANVSLSREQKAKMIDKLLGLLSRHQAVKVRKNIHVTGNYGINNEQLYYSIDQITEAISKNRKIEYQYYTYAPNGEITLRSKEEFSVMTPIGITCNNNRYYIFGYDGVKDRLVIERLDCMTKTRMIDEAGDRISGTVNADEFLDSLFSMEIGILTEVVLECANELMDVIKDRFGADADIWKSTTESFYVKAKISVSPAFYSWIFRYAGKLRIISPASIHNGYLNMLQGALRKEKSK